MTDSVCSEWVTTQKVFMGSKGETHGIEGASGALQHRRYFRRTRAAKRPC